MATESQNKKESPSSRAGLIFCGLFLALLWLPLLDSMFKLDQSPVPVENRELASFPKLGLGLSGLKNYFSGLESYYNDHFGFRKLLIRVHGHAQTRYFKQGSTEVLIGRDQWLFYAGNYALDVHMGLRPLSEEKLKAWRSLLESRRDRLSAKGIKYLFVAAANKESIYPEQLPGWANKAGAVTQMDQFLAYMRSNSTVEILDLRPVLLEARKHARTFLLTDTHWNQFGAFAAYQEIIRTLARQLPGIEPLPLEAFSKSYSNESGADLARMLAQEQAMTEPDVVTLKPLPPLHELTCTVDTNIFHRKWVPGEEPRFTENPEQKYKAVVFRDSFSGALTPLLGYQFKRIVYIWQRPWEPSVIENEKPDVVIDEMLERYLDWSWPFPEK